jgi:hypothetical protein
MNCVCDDKCQKAYACIEHGSCLVAGTAISCSVSIVQKIADDAPCIECNQLYDTDDGN